MVADPPPAGFVVRVAGCARAKDLLVIPVHLLAPHPRVLYDHLMATWQRAVRLR